MPKTRKPHEDDEEKIVRENIQKRFKAMFSGKGEPLSNMSIQEVEVLKGRVAELEEKLAQQGTAPLETKTFEVPKVSDNQPLPPGPVAGTQKHSAPNFVSNALRISQIGFVASIIAASFYLYLALQFGAWQLYAWSADIWILALVGLINIILVRRGHADRAMWLLIAAISITFIGAVALVEGIGLLLGVSIVALIPIIAGQTLPAKPASRAIIFGVVSGVVAILLDFLLPAYRFPRPEPVRVFLPIILGVVILLFGYVTIRQFRDYSLRTKMIIVFTITVVSMLGIAAFLTNRGLTASLTENIGNNLAALANSKAIEIGQIVDRESDVLKSLALNQNYQNAAKEANEANVLSQTEIERLDRKWRDADAANNNTDVLVARVLKNDLAGQLRQFQKQFPQHVEVFLTDRQGVNIAATNRTSDYYQADEEWWQAAYEEGLFISQPEYDESSKTIAIIMATPVRSSQNGEIVGILRTTVDFEALADSLIAGRFGQSGRTDIYLPNAQEIELETQEDGSLQLTMQEAELDINLLTQSKEPYLETVHNNVPILASQAMVSVVGDVDEDNTAISNLNWRVVAIQDQAEALLPVAVQGRNFLLLSIVLSIAAVLAAVGLAQLLVGPLTRLTVVANQIAGGNLAARAQVETSDETGVLAVTFNNMTLQLQNLFGSLEQRVQDRTHDLELAAEVGRTVTEKVADAGEMLTTAAEMIRARFDLYYTQVYLAVGEKLVLRAGTGEVGQELLNRGHHLSINSSSLNGQAVLEKRAVIVADTRQSATFKPNPLLPRTRSEMAVPLIAGDQVIGVLDMQSERPDALNETNLPAFEALAGQLAIAIENAALFAQAEQARTEVESQMHRLTEHGWQDFLDAIDHGQKIGYVFDQSKVTRLRPESLSTKAKDHNLSIPIQVTGTKVGEIHLPVEPDRPWDSDELELIKATSAQLAQHIQNLRLLAQAERFRVEAEQAVRRLTREGWENYQQLRTNEAPGYMFNLVDVQPLTANSNGHVPAALKQPLLIRGETVGELAVDQAIGDEETAEILNAVAEQLSQHVETLRLSEETEKRSSELATVAGQLSEALDIARLANWEYDVNRDRFHFNDHFYSIFHTTAQEVGGYEVSSAEYAQRFVHPDDVPMVGEAIGKALASTDRHYNLQLEHRILYADGGVGYISVNVHIERDEQGNILRYYGANQDITERKKAEMVIQESEAQLSEALDIARLANWEYDVVRDRFIFNDHFYSIFHTTAQEVGGYEISSEEYAKRFVHPEDLHMVGDEIGKALASTDRHYSTHLEHRILYKDGGVGYISVDLHIERDEQGNILRYYGANQDITERKKAEMVIQESEARLSEALDIAKLAHWEFDLERDIFTFNDQFYSIFHTTADKVGGYELSSTQYAQLFVHPDDAALVGVEIGKAIASTDRHYTKQLEHRILFADGGVGYISVDINIERDESGKITRWYGANQDITERKKAEMVIQESETRLSEALDIARLANWEYDVARDRFLFNDHFYSIFHTSAQEVGGYEISSEEYAKRFVHPDDVPMVGEAIGKALSSTDRHYNVQLEHRILYADSGVGYISVNVHIERDEQGNILRYYGANQDITERKLAEEIIAQRARQLATVAGLSSTTSTLLDPDKLLQTVVDLTKERFGLYHAHIYLADDSWNTLLLAAGAGEVGRQMVAEGWNIPMDHEQSIVARAALTQQSVIANDVIRDKNSSFLSNQLLPDTRSEMAVPMIVGQKLLGVFDVQAETVNHFSEEDANIYTTLAAQVAVALQNARLYVEQAATVTQLRELDKLKSSFLANMSHELRTPLNSILGFTDVMLEELDGPLTEHMDNDLRLIQKNGQHLLHLINDVLDMAKIEAGRMNLSPENFKAFDVMEEVTSITSTLASEKNLSLFIEETSEQDVEIYADRTRLRQVLINLVNNAIKFTEAGKVSLKVTSLPGARVLITVQDTGIGIAPDKLDAVFQEFTQVDASSTRKAGGTGLGLPISRRLVEMHGGRLWAESTGVPGEGSVFFVELPLEARITEVVEKQEK